MPVSMFNKEKCICQICICGEHRCDSTQKCLLNEKSSKVEEKTSIESKIVELNDKTDNEDTSSEQGKTRRQWETSPDQMKEISRSLSQINGLNSGKRDKELVRSKRATNEKLTDSQANRPTLPPINISLSDSDSGREEPQPCICEQMSKSNTDLRVLDNRHESNQWVVSRPIKNRPKDNLRMEGMMEMETTFKSTYDSTAKQIKTDSLSKNVGIVMPSHRLSSEESNFERLKRSKITDFNAMKSTKKRVKDRPSTSLKAGGDSYFNTINKESYKNFVIIDDNCKQREKAKSSSNGKKSSVCCNTVSNIKLPKVNTRDEKQCYKTKNREERGTQIEQIDRSMKRLTTKDTLPSDVGLRYIESGVQTNGENKVTISDEKVDEKSSPDSQLITQRTDQRETDLNESWTVDALGEHPRVFTRDVDSIKELGLDKMMAQTDSHSRRSGEKEKRVVPMVATKDHKSDSDKSQNGSTRVRIESTRHYVQSQRRQKKHKNESSVKLFSGQMDFQTTTNTYYSDKSPNRAEAQVPEREKTAGKKSRKSGRKRNLFRTSTEAEFYKPYGESTAETTYQKQFGDRLYCPAIDLGSTKSDFKYSSEASGHQFFLPAVKY